jgi:hypothetical protein
MFRKFFLTAAVAVLGGLIAPSAAKAQFVLTLSAAGTSTVTIDFANYTVNQLETVSGVGYNIEFIVNSANSVSILYPQSTYAGYGLGSTLTTTSPNVGLSAESQADFTVTDSSATSALTIGLSSGGFNVSNPNVTLWDTLSGSGMNGGALSNAYTTVGSSSVVNAQTNSIGISGNTTVSSNFVTGILTAPTSTTLADYVTIAATPTGSDTFSFTSNIVASPAPSGLIIAATMIPFFGVLRRRLRGMAKETPVIS